MILVVVVVVVVMVVVMIMIMMLVMFILLQAQAACDVLPEDMRLITTYEISSSSSSSCKFGIYHGCCSSPACADMMAGDFCCL